MCRIPAWLPGITALSGRLLLPGRASLCRCNCPPTLAQSRQADMPCLHPFVPDVDHDVYYPTTWYSAKQF